MMMKLTLSLLTALTYNAFAKEDIVNDTTKPMLCIEKYDSIYEKKEINGETRNVKVKDNEEIISTLSPSKSISKKREGSICCYNELGKFNLFEDGRVQKATKEQLQSHKNIHEYFDLTKYANKDRDFVGKNFSIAQRCAPYKGGLYCHQFFGLDIIYDKEDKVSTILLYENTLKNNKLPFAPESILDLYVNSMPLGLWVKESYKKLFSKKPTIHTKNLIVWENLTPYIKRVIMTPKNGYHDLSHKMKDGFNLYRVNYKDSKEPTDYLGAIEVQYK
ncbi:MAG TPA: hypothetical protein CFH79_06070 [Sulfurospirillum sp. UBA11407]|jgi:hypothetical protein|nr:MAG TPA: hypothetical protein CFH79_06070 [Sulfurospirillum sp. UBA11407]